MYVYITATCICLSPCSTAVKDRIVGFLLFLGKVAIVGLIGELVDSMSHCSMYTQCHRSRPSLTDFTLSMFATLETGLDQP